MVKAAGGAFLSVPAVLDVFGSMLKRMLAKRQAHAWIEHVAATLFLTGREECA